MLERKERKPQEQKINDCQLDNNCFAFKFLYPSSRDIMLSTTTSPTPGQLRTIFGKSTR